MKPCGVLGASLCFSDRVVYAGYSAAPNIFVMRPLDNQVFGGALRWVIGSFVYLVRAVIITAGLPLPETGRQAKRDCPQGKRLTIRMNDRSAVGCRSESSRTAGQMAQQRKT